MPKLTSTEAQELTANLKKAKIKNLWVKSILKAANKTGAPDDSQFKKLVTALQKIEKNPPKVKGVEINDDAALESEADVMGEKALKTSMS